VGIHPDPADRWISAAAMAASATLITADIQLLGWAGPMSRQDARQ
jgi:PIN domain nuclease of toxin-antitoxin system